MSNTSDIAWKEKKELLDKLEEKYSKKATEDFFGIVVKEIDTEKHLYNLYKDNELVLAKKPIYCVEDFFKWLICRFVQRMCKEAEPDDNYEETERKLAELEKRELENEKENYETCHICGARVKKGRIHFHN